MKKRWAVLEDVVQILAEEWLPVDFSGSATSEPQGELHRDAAFETWSLEGLIP